MKNGRNLTLLLLLALICAGSFSCKVQYGCPANGRSVGAERILSGEKVPKAPKFKA